MTGTSSITRYTPAVEAASSTVQSESYSRFGGKSGDQNLDVTIHVVDANGSAGGVSVTIDLYRATSKVSTATGTTDSAGNVTFSYRKLPCGGCYAADVTVVSRAGDSWDDSDPTTTSC